MLVRNEDEIYALTENKSCPECVSFPFCRKMHNAFITKNIPELNSWEDICPVPRRLYFLEKPTKELGTEAASSLDLSSARRGICVIAKDKFIFFLGGFVLTFLAMYKTLTDADRYDLGTNTWDKIADLKEPRRNAYGGSAYSKMFIAGGEKGECMSSIRSCEVYNETTNEWQLIAAVPSVMFTPTWMSADEKLY